MTTRFDRVFDAWNVRGGAQATPSWSVEANLNALKDDSLTFRITFCFCISILQSGNERGAKVYNSRIL
jgi:hypothetical protein